jgi:hypothetical protein
MRAPRATSAVVHWPEGARNVTPAVVDSLFEGDTLVASARFDGPVPDAPVALEVTMAGGEVARQVVRVVPLSSRAAPVTGATAVPGAFDVAGAPGVTGAAGVAGAAEDTSLAAISTVARLAAAARLDEFRVRHALRSTDWLGERSLENSIDESTAADMAEGDRQSFDATAARATAVRYQLVSPWTNYLVVAERPEDEKAAEMPVLRKVPHTLAAGWGGNGMVMHSMSVDAVDSARSMALRCLSAPPPMGDVFPAYELDDGMPFGRESGSARVPGRDASGHEPIPRVSRRTREADMPDRFARLLAVATADDAGEIDTPDAALHLLERAGLADEFGELFAEGRALGLRREWVAALVVLALAAVFADQFGQEALARKTAGLAAEAERVAQRLAIVARRSDEAAQLARSARLRQAIEGDWIDQRTREWRAPAQFTGRVEQYVATLLRRQRAGRARAEPTDPSRARC